MKKEILEQLYNDYFEGDILLHSIFERNIEELGDYRIRIIVEDSNRQELIFKGYCNDYNDITLANSYCTYMSDLKGYGVEVPKVYKNTSGNYAKSLMIDEREYIFWVEEKIVGTTLDNHDGFEVGNVFFRRIGQLLGEQHSISRLNNLMLSSDTEFRFSYNDMDENHENLNALIEIASKYSDFEDAIKRIKYNYLQLREMLYLHIDKLRFGAVQGDLSPNNIMMRNKNPVC